MCTSFLGLQDPGNTEPVANNPGHSVFHSFGGQKSKVKVSAGPRPSTGSGDRLSMQLPVSGAPGVPGMWQHHSALSHLTPLLPVLLLYVSLTGSLVTGCRILQDVLTSRLLASLHLRRRFC